MPWAIRGDHDLSPLHWKLVIDARDPHAQADFWAAALGYEVEDHSALIGKLLDLGAISPEILVGHHDRRAWRDAAAVRHPGDPYDAESGAGRGRRLLFNRAPEQKTAKNHLHIDLHPRQTRGTQRSSASTPSAPGSTATSRNRAASGWS